MRFLRRWLMIQLLKGLIEMANVEQALNDLAAQVTATVGVEASALALINSIPALISAAGVDPVKLSDLQNALKASADALAAGVAAQTQAPVPAPAVTVQVQGDGTVIG